MAETNQNRQKKVKIDNWLTGQCKQFKIFSKNHSIITKQSSTTKKVIQNTLCVGRKGKSKGQQPEEMDQKPMKTHTSKKPDSMFKFFYIKIFPHFHEDVSKSGMHCISIYSIYWVIVYVM